MRGSPSKLPSTHRIPCPAPTHRPTPPVPSCGLPPPPPQVTLNGPADPARLQPSGQVVLESGTLNLVATQLSLDRQHNNRIVFAPTASGGGEQGAQAGGGGAGGGGGGGDEGSGKSGGGAAAIDPMVDVVLLSGDLRAAIQVRVGGRRGSCLFVQYS